MDGYRWKLEDSAGCELARSESFVTQEEAEVWLGSEWRALLAGGSESATLVRGAERLYRMGLREA